MVSFYLQESGSIRCYVKVKGFDRIRKAVNSKIRVQKSHRWIDQRVSGKNSITINQELDRIQEEIETFILQVDLSLTSQNRLDRKIEEIITNQRSLNNSSLVARDKTIDEHFQDFLTEKRTEINPNTKKLLSYSTISSYETIFKYFEGYELSDVTKLNYHKFVGQLLANKSVNYTGKIIRKLKTFFIWCDDNGIEINKEYRHWKPLNEETEEEERALNSEQLNRIYTINVDPVDVYQIAKDKFKKDLNAKQVNDLCDSIREAARQAVAMASCGPHKEDFWRLTDRNVRGKLLVYGRGKNEIKAVAPFRDNSIFHAREFANLNGGKLFKRLVKINEYLKYVKEICDLPFDITASTMRKTFASIMYFELNAPLRTVQEALAHKKEETTRKYLGLQMADAELDHEELFKDM